jgi:hypothetical protein
LSCLEEQKTILVTIAAKNSKAKFIKRFIIMAPNTNAINTLVYFNVTLNPKIIMSLLF